MGEFMPHGHCYLWDPLILALNVGSDFLIAISYLIIPVFLIYIIRKKPDFRFGRVFFMFAAFIIACGISHLFDIWTVWNPDYRIAGLERLITAFLSVSTVVGLARLMPKILALPSHGDLERSLNQLRSEITQRQKAEAIVHENEERFRIMVESVRDYAIFMIDPAGNIATWNKGAQQIKGYSAEEIIGCNYARFFTEDDLEGGLPGKILQRARVDGRYETEGRRRRKNGDEFWANVVVTPLYDKEQRIIGYIKVIKDISDRKKADDELHRLNNELLLLNDDLEGRVESRTQELRKKQDQLLAIANSLPVLIGEITTDEQILFANDLFRKWVVKSSYDLIGKQLREFLEASRYIEIRNYLEEAKRGRSVAFVREIPGEEGTSWYFQVNYIPEFDESRNVKSIILVATDITKHVLAEKELKQAKEFADAANLAKSAFLANMSHEIRTPLGAILGFSELLMKPHVSHEEKESFAETIRRNGESLTQIINDILDLSKIEAGKISIHMKKIPIEDVFADLSSLLRLQATERKIDFKVECDESVPKLIVSDPLRLRQILLNIVGNAIKFTEKGHVWVSIRIDPDEAVGPKMVFDIKDTGIGIDKEEAIKLFKPFSQIDSSYKRRYGGTGLGLILSKHLANLLGGDVILTNSKVGVGSHFTVTIDPGEIDHDELLFSQRSPLPQSSSRHVMIRQPEDQEHQKANILVVDDSADNLALVGFYLNQAGFHVETAEHGAEALEKIDLKDFDIIIMDLQMPVMDGFEATEALRSRGCDIPIIALTAHAFEENRQKCLDRGFSDFLTKPINSGLLLGRVQALLKKSIRNGC